MNIRVCNKCHKIKLDQIDFRIVLMKGVYYYRTGCVNCENELRKDSYYKNIEHEQYRGKVYKMRHKKESKLRDFNYYENHKTEKAQYRLAHRQHYLDMQKQHYRDNTSYYILKKNTRRSTTDNQKALLTDNEKAKIEILYKICAYLNKELPKTGWHVDHIKPLSKGGSHCPNNLWIIPAKDNRAKFNNEYYELNHNIYFKL